MAHELNEESLAGKILALFKDHKELSSLQITQMLSEENPDRLKGAMHRLRGKGGVKRLRVKGYVKIAGRAGFEVPVLELGNTPDVVKNEDNISIDDEAIKRAKAVRAKREELRFKKEMADLDW